MSSQPLDGVTVVDLTHVLAGPYAAMTLSDLGARVIKVERPEIGDDTRAFAPFVDGESACFATINRGKESIALDLKAEADRAIFERMLDRADVVLENFRPGVMEKLGYGWEDLHARWPHLIYGAVSGYGHNGPWSLKPAYDMVVQAEGGVMSITGEAGREPVRCGASIGDITAGQFLTQGVLAALYDRTRTGEGRKIDVAMLDSQLAIIEHAVAIASATGTPPGPTGARHPSIAPFETYHAEDGLIVIAAGNDALFARACEALGLDGMAEEPQFATNADRVRNVRALKRRFEMALLYETVDFWIEKLEAAGVPTGRIQSVDEVMAHPQIAARNMVATLAPDAGGRRFAAAGDPIKISGRDDPTERPAAPALDGDRAAILAWLEG
ncbi:MAG: CaiB/BaiF CoA-transferase family protein [Pseudomonadota bacterium]